MTLFNYSRRPSSVVEVGGVPVGGDNPVRIQSMTDLSTHDIEGCVEQAKRIVDAGGEYVRLTTQGIREAENLKEIKEKLRAGGYRVPLIADVHFNPKVADVAARYADKVRINPGNYVDAPRTFRAFEYTGEEYTLELQKIRERFVPFLNICRERRTAVRIGVNHGSLSDRIMSRYGDTPEGMVESCMEFLRICVEENFTDVVVSIKASNTVLMVRTVRLLAFVMAKEDMKFPLHLGVTEAGDGEDGRIKSALGIGALLADGLGDTIRVSLSEAPEAEIPVARKLLDYVRQEGSRDDAYDVKTAGGFNYLSPARRKTLAVRNIGGENLPVAISERMTGKMKVDPRFKPDYIYLGRRVRILKKDHIPGQQYIVDNGIWRGVENTWPAFRWRDLDRIDACRAELKFVFLSYENMFPNGVECLKRHPEAVVIAQGRAENVLGDERALAHSLMEEGLTNPLVVFHRYDEKETEDFQLKAAADLGGLMVDGFCDGLMLINHGNTHHLSNDATIFGILQAGRLRTSKTEYISCPGCGRTLFNLQETITRIKAATSHLKGLKIGIMGCIVNGPGEMADADYGYVGAGRGKVSLYKKKECIEKNIPEEEAVDKLIELIKANGDFI